MNAVGYTIVAGLAVVGAVVTITVAQNEVVATALLGLAGTVIGRGKS